MHTASSTLSRATEIGMEKPSATAAPRPARSTWRVMVIARGTRGVR